MDKKRIRNGIISIVIGIAIVWLLLSNVDPRDIPKAISRIQPHNLALAFLLYTIAVFFKAVRFRIILGSGISLRRIFPIVSMYMFFANILPMRTGELSYVYLLKKQASTPGTKSFASLVIGGIADAFVILIAMIIVGWHLRDALADSSLYFADSFISYISSLKSRVFQPLSVLITAGFAAVVAIVVMLIRRRRGRNAKYIALIKAKFLEVIREVANVSLDIRLAGIFIFSILIILFRFVTQWYLVRSMEIGIGIWELAFAILFGVLFSLIPIHGPAGLGTVEAPWVLALMYLNISKEDAITSGFGLHIMIIVFCTILGLYGFFDTKYTGNAKDIKVEKLTEV